MLQRFSPRAVVLAGISTILLLLIGTFRPTHALSPQAAAVSPAEVVEVATAPAPPELVPAILNGQPIQVLYMTRAGDRVLVRCYPGIEPTLTLMEGSQGLLVCQPPATTP